MDAPAGTSKPFPIVIGERHPRQERIFARGFIDHQEADIAPDLIPPPPLSPMIDHARQRTQKEFFLAWAGPLFPTSAKPFVWPLQV